MVSNMTKKLQICVKNILQCEENLYKRVVCFSIKFKTNVYKRPEYIMPCPQTDLRRNDPENILSCSTN